MEQGKTKLINLEETKVNKTEKPDEPYTFRGYDNPNIKKQK